MLDKNGQKLSFSIIKHRGTPNEATTTDGLKVERQEKIWIDNLPGFVRCAPYDNHFVYLDPSKVVGRWFAMCTCGSPAVLVGSNAYDHLGSPEGMMLVCYTHTLHNKHADGST